MTISATRILALRYFPLLVSLVILLILTPVVEVAGLQGKLLTLLFSLVLIAAVHVASRNRAQRVTAVALAIPWLVVSWAELFTDIPQSDIPEGVLLSCLLYFTMFVVTARMVTYKTADFDALCGGVALYLLIGISWAVSYRLIETIAPGSFATTQPQATEFFSRYLYFSFTTMTTLGYGDIAPVNPVAQIWAVLEAIAGLFYIALLISRLIALYRN